MWLVYGCLFGRWCTFSIQTDGGLICVSIEESFQIKSPDFLC